jgi:hypothetical protein
MHHLALYAVDTREAFVREAVAQLLFWGSIGSLPVSILCLWAASRPLSTPVFLTFLAIGGTLLTQFLWYFRTLGIALADKGGAVYPHGGCTRPSDSASPPSCSSCAKRPNQAMQLTASKPAIYAFRGCRRVSMLRGMHRGLAAADLVSR